MVISDEQMVALRFIFGTMEPKVVILMFASGKLVCTGAKIEREVYENIRRESIDHLRFPLNTIVGDSCARGPEISVLEKLIFKRVS